MKNTKKILAVVLSVMLLISVMPFAAFAAEPPTATVTPLALADITNVATIDGKTITFDKGYKFVANDDAETVQQSAYKTYSADYVIKADRDLPAGSVTLGGQYNGNASAWVTLTSAEAIPANTEVRLLQTLLGESVYTYEDICTLVREFNCAVKTNDASVAGANITVELRIYETEYDAETGTYTEKEGAEPIAINDVVYELETPKVAQIGDVRYASFEEALAAISTVSTAKHSKAVDPNYDYKTYVANGTIKLLANTTSNGIIIGSGSNLVVDFNGKTLDINEKPVGSNGTESIALQLLKNSNITFKNGTLTSSYTYSETDTEYIQRLIQNYSNLTLDHMNVTMTGNFMNTLTISTCNGNFVVKDSTVSAPDFSAYGYTTATAAEQLGAEAFTLGTFSSYTAATATVQGDSTINGNVSVDVTNPDVSTNTLTLTGGTLNGDIVMKDNADSEGVEITKANTFTQDAPEGYEWVEAADGKSATLVKIPEPPTATVTQLPSAQITNVATTDGKIITFDKGYKFVANDDATSVQESAYKTYSADYVITSDTALPAGSVTLGGQYNDNDPAWVTLTNAEAIPANTEVRLLQTLLGERVYTYEDICTLVREFNCAIKTNDASVAGANITVELRIYETEQDAETGTYTEKAGAEPIAIDDVVYVLETPKVAQIGDVRYETLEAAFAAAQDGDTITVLADCAGNGIKVPQGKFATGLTVDFGGHTYTVDGTTVGSTGTETQGFQLLKNNNITFQNGKIYGDSTATATLKFLIQNYSNLTLDNMELELIGKYYNQYTLSNNNGNIVINDSIINAADYSWAGLDASDVNSFAFDVCRYSSYPSVSVTVTGNSVINGDVEVSASNNDAKNGLELNLVSGTMSGDIVLADSAKALINAEDSNATVQKAAGFAKEAPEGFEWDEDGILVPVAEPVNGGSLTLDDGVKFNAYLDADAYGVDVNEAIVKITYNANSDLNDKTVNIVTVTKALSEVEKYVDETSPYNGTYKFTLAQAPAQMNEDIVIELYANADETGPVASITTSAAELCKAVIASEDATQGYKDLCASLLDYGRAAQIYFSYDLENLAAAYNNAQVTTLGYGDMRTTAAALNGVPFKGVSFTVLSTTEWNIIVKEAQTVETISGVPGASATAATLLDKSQAIKVTGIDAADFAKAFTVYTNSGSVTLSAAMIARSIVKTSSNTNYQDLARAFYLYGVQAESFFAA